MWSVDTTVILEPFDPSTFTLDGYCEELDGRFFDPLSQPEQIVAYIDVLGRSVDPAAIHTVGAGPIFIVYRNRSVRKLKLFAP
jgi:hypothetical protein